MRWGKGEKLLRNFNGKKLITFFLLIILNFKEQRAVKLFHPRYRISPLCETLYFYTRICGIYVNEIELSNGTNVPLT